MSKKNYLIDENGNPYIQDKSWPAGGGLDKRCDFNQEALDAFNDEDEKDDEYLDDLGFKLVHCDYPHIEVWEKGNTRIVLESHIGGMWGYVHTEYIG